MHSDNRLEIEESGNHVLFLVTGFLEYRQSELQGASTYTAPLLLLPVFINRGDIDPSTDLDLAEDVLVDDHPLADLPCIYAADSSQQRALIDAMEGKNLVIVGLPGTGKSQTITNLIALTISRGKTVLFVSDKKAGLEVVHKRIEAAGLGEFCLELHSNKTCKKALLRSLESRLSQSWPDIKTLNSDLRNLQNL